VVFSFTSTAITADEFGAAMADPSWSSTYTTLATHHFYRRDPWESDEGLIRG
jgi:hypothetical protein